MKLMAQLALLFVVVWIVAAAFGQKPGMKAPPSMQRNWDALLRRYGPQAAKAYQPSVAQGAYASGIQVPYGQEVL